MKIIAPLFFLLFVVSALAQNESCDGSRFIDDVFTDISVTTDIKYGEGTSINGLERELYLDVYEPIGDDAESRPVIFWAFGGSFITGNKADVDFLCEAYARKGYVAVAIDYRLYDGALLPLPTGVQMQEVVVKAVADMKGAIRYMRNDADNANLFRIDPNMVIVGGISAGAIVASHAAVLDESDPFDASLRAIIDAQGGLEGNTNDLEYSSSVNAFVNFSGGLASASFIDQGDPRFYSVHDDNDQTVPYGSGFARVLGQDIIFMEGSMRLSERADSVGVDNTLLTFENSSLHVSYFLNNTDAAAVISGSAEFVGSIVCEEPNTVDDIGETTISIFPNPTNGIVNIKYESSEPTSIYLLDISGRTLKTWNNTSQIDISNFEAGGYILTIKNKVTGSLISEYLVLAR